MAITPNSNIKLLKCPIKIDDANQLLFNNLEEQTAYFNNLESIELTNATYQRRDSVIRYPAHIDSIQEFNYCMYQNSNYTNKWFYAFISRMEYVSDTMTFIYIRTDVFQTWMFNIQYMESFVEREHVSNDAIGVNTIPENLETGDFISTNAQPNFSDNLSTCFCLAVTELIDQTTYTYASQIMPVGLYYIGIRNLNDVQTYVRKYDNAGKASAINSVFVIPDSFFSNWITKDGFTGLLSYSVNFSYSSDITVPRPNSIGTGYVPKNNKMYVYPYSFLQVSNHSGEIINYKWEDFDLFTPALIGSIKFRLRGTLTPSGSFKAFPLNYKNILNNNDDTINLGKFPIGAYNSDTYTNWLTQNAVNNGLQVASGILQVASSPLQALTGNPVGASTSAGSGLLAIAGTIGNIYTHSLLPDNVSGNTNSGDVNFANDLITLEFKRMSIKNEYARVIDDFWSMFGYKVNRVKVPNIRGRRNWNYVKTIDADILGSIPQYDLDEIKGLFNNGLTIWHNPSTFMDYSQNNDII